MKKKKKTKNKKQKYIRKEFSYQSFCRSFNLPNTINTETIDASYKDGILQITIQKQADEIKSKSKKIEIH